MEARDAGRPLRAANLIIVPAFNEAPRISALLEKARRCRPEDDIVVIDDGSTDATAALARAAGALVVHHPVNLGYGASLQTGIKYALAGGYTTGVFLDGDGQHEPDELSRLLAPVAAGEADVVIGSRFLSGDPYRVGPLRWIGMGLFGWIVRLLTSIDVTDPTSGARALNRRAMRLYTLDGFPDEFPDANAIVLYHRAGFRVKEIAVRMYPSVKKRPMHRGFNVLYYIFNVFFSIFISLLQKGPQIRKE